jgi:CheY-like chemotaxis protein
MADTLSVIIVDDDEGHATLVRRNMKRAGLEADLIHLHDGQEVLDYLYRRGAWTARAAHEAMALVLDLNMPRLGGMAVLERLKGDEDLTRIPVFVLTTTNNPNEINQCYTLGASACLVKPVDFGKFGEMIQRFAAFLMTASMPGEADAFLQEHDG